MAKRNITRTRKITQANKARDKDLVLQWRALRKAGVYDTKELPSAGRLTKSRREKIRDKFKDLQGLGTYENGVIYRPLHKQSETRPVYRRDEMGRQRFVRTQKTERYVMDTDHFQVFKRKPKAVPGDSLKTPKGMIAPKSPNEKLSITKDGKIRVEEKKIGLKTILTREPLSGPTEFLALMDDVMSGRLKFKKDEGLQLINNGIRESPIYGQSAIMGLMRRLQRYAAAHTHLVRKHGGAGNFDDWASSSEIVHRRRK